MAIADIKARHEATKYVIHECKQSTFMMVHDCKLRRRDGKWDEDGGPTPNTVWTALALHNSARVSLRRVWHHSGWACDFFVSIREHSRPVLVWLPGLPTFCSQALVQFESRVFEDYKMEQGPQCCRTNQARSCKNTQRETASIAFAADREC